MATARQLFGTDGVRGVANREPMTAETALRLGRAMAQLCAAPREGRSRIVIGRDTRLSGPMLEGALAAGICSAGVDVLLGGVLPTPAIAFLTRTLPAAAGVVVSASHNAFADNGIKFFAASGFKLSDETELEIEQRVLQAGPDPASPIAADLGTVGRLDDSEECYVTFLASALPAHLRLAGLKVVIDTAHGAAYRIGPHVLERLGAAVVRIGATPDGTNINAGCGAVHPQRLQEAVLAHGAAVGIAVDGDADRVVLVDEHGAVVDGDEILAMVATDMIAQGTLRQATVVATVMSNLGLEVALRGKGARLVRVQVGDRYVVEEMRRGGYTLGGEQSGHIVFLEHNTTGDGLWAGLNIIKLMIERQRPLSELKRAMSKFPQVLLNVRVARRQDLDEVAPVRDTIARITAALNDRGHVLVRYSGTEPLVRVMVEGEEEAQVQSYAEEIAALIQRHLGVQV